MKNGFKKINKAFTLVELIVVIAIIAILSAVSVAGYFGLTESANKSVAQQELKQVMDQYTNYQILNSSKAYSDIYEGCDGFVYYLIENEPSFSNKLNYTVDAEQISYVKSRNSYTVKKASDAGNVTFLVKTSSNYFATFSVPYSGAKLGSVTDSNNNSKIHKSLQKATDAVFNGKDVSVDNWEYKIETSGTFVEDPNRYTINLYNGDLSDSSRLSTIVMRGGGKTLDKVSMDKAVTIVDYYAYDNEVTGSFYQNGVYLVSSISAWNYYDEQNALKEWDFSSPITSDLSLISHTELNDSYDEVARIIRDNGEEYKRFDTQFPDEKIATSSYKSYHFSNLENAIEFAEQKTVNRTYYLYKVTSSGVCNPVYTAATEPYDSVVETGVKSDDEIQIRNRHAVITKDIELKEGTFISLEYAEGRSGYGYEAALLDGTAWYKYVEEDVLEKHDAYSTITVNEGVNFDIYGKIVVGAFTSTYKNFVLNYVYVNETASSEEEQGGFAQIINNGCITLHNSATLECYGFITGEGTIDALNGSTITDLFTIYNWPGGTAASSVYTKSFIFNEYSINNVRCISNIYYGARYNAYAAIYIPSGPRTEYETLGIVGSDSSSLFTLTNTSELGNNSFIRKGSKFDLERNALITTIEMYGDAYENYFSINGFSLKKVYFPIYKMDITIQSGTFEVKNNEFMVMPGSRVKISADAKVIVSENGSFAVMENLNYNNKAEFEYNGFNVPGVLEIDGSLEVETSVTGLITINQGGSYKFGPACSYTADVTYGMGMVTKVSNAYPLATNKTVLSIIDKNQNKEYYTISFQSEGDIVVNDQFVEEGSSISLVSPIRDGFKFDGWYTTSTFDDGTKVENEFTALSSMILYAKWIENTVTEDVL